jgi:hypothetical protein
MSLLNGLTPPTRKLTCKVQTTWENLEPEDAEIFDKAVNDSNTWAARTLANALQNRGISISDLSITRHRNGNCSC